MPPDGATRRKGVDAQLNVHPVAGLSVWGALSWQQAVIRTPPASAPGTAGNEVDHTPHWLWSGGIDWLPIEPLTLSLSGRGQSSYYLSSANIEGKWGKVTVLDASALFRATEALESRIWAGIHFRHELAAGKVIGMAVAQKVLEHAGQDGALTSR